jgi:hypothetical protein
MAMATSVIGIALAIFPAVTLAHGHDDDGMDMGAEEPKVDPSTYPPTYFAHPEHTKLIYTHIAIMIFAWILALPVGKRIPQEERKILESALTAALELIFGLAVMLSLARSRHRLIAQLFFLSTNAIGLFLGTLYNANTPDLYPNNAHYKLGWVATWTACAQVVLGVLGNFTSMWKTSNGRETRAERQQFLPVSAEMIAEHELVTAPQYLQSRRHSNDSGQGTERNTESLRGSSVSSTGSERLRGMVKEQHDGEEDGIEMEMIDLRLRKRHNWLIRLQGMLSRSRPWKIFDIAYNTVDRVILPLGSVALATGVVTYGRFFVSSRTESCERLCRISALTGYLGRAADLHGPSPLDQGRDILLARNFHLRPMVWKLWRAWLG